MHAKPTVLHAALVSAIGTTGLVTAIETSASSLVIDGQYEMRILETACCNTTTYGGTQFKITPPTGLESSFTLGDLPNAYSQGMTDNDTLVSVTNDWSAYYGPDGLPGNKGTSTVDSYAGLITFDVVDGTIRNATSFSVDTIFATPLGDFSQFISNDDLSGFSGSIDAAGNMIFAPTGRMAAVNGPAGGVMGRWVIDWETAPSTSTTPIGYGDFPWDSFTTGAASGIEGHTLNGTACSGTAGDYSCTLVNAGQVGTFDWGWVYGTEYFEVWKTDLVRIGDAAVVPVPPALWLFGSGLLGLIGISRSKRSD